MRGYFTIGEACGMFQKLLKALKFDFSAQGKTTNLKIISYTPSEGEIFREIEPAISEMIATGEAVKEVGPVILERMPDDQKFYNFRMRFALGTLIIDKEDLIKKEQGSLLTGFAGLVQSINDIEIGDEELIERKELIDEAERIGVVWTKPLDEYELYEIRDAIAVRRLSMIEEPDEPDNTKPLSELNGDELINLALKIGITPERVDATETDEELRAFIEANEPTTCYGEIEDPDDEEGDDGARTSA